MSKKNITGFSLIEMAIVLAITGLFLGLLLSTLSAQREMQNIVNTRNTLEQVKTSLMSYAMTNGRLPCPAAAPQPDHSVKAVEQVNITTAGDCVTFNGFVPGVTLGLAPLNQDGYVLDEWGYPLFYAVSNITDNQLVAGTKRFIYTSTNGIKDANVSNTDTTSACKAYTGMAYASCAAMLFVCTGKGSGSNCGTATSLITNTNTATPGGGAVFVVFSTGKNTPQGSQSSDESENINGDNIFVSHDIQTNSASYFDDLVIWMPTTILFYSLVQVNKLP